MEKALDPSYPVSSSITFRNGCLNWTDRTTQSQHSIPTDQLVAILPQSLHSPRTNEDDTAPASSAPSFTALYLVREPPDENEHTAQLKAVAIPEHFVKDTDNGGDSNGASLQRHLVPHIPAHLQTKPTATTTIDNGNEHANSQRDIHVVISTLSGTQGALPVFEKALKPLLDILYGSYGDDAYQVHKTESSQTISELCERIFLPRASAGAGQTIILLSGDGGAVDIIHHFSQALLLPLEAENNDDLTSAQSTGFVSPTLCLMPLGTGNATANSAGLTADKTLGLSSLMCGTPHDLPTFRVQVPWNSVYLTDEGRKKVPVKKDESTAPAVLHGAVVLSWGMHATLVADSDTTEYRKFGVARFKMAAKELLWPSHGGEPHRFQGSVSVVPTKQDGSRGPNEVVGSTEHMYILATLVSQLEKGFTISPSSRPLYGQLHLVHFGPVAAERAMEIMSLAYQGGKHVAEPEVSYVAIEKVRIELREEDERWRRICLDGTIIAVPEGGWVEVQQEEKPLVRLVAP